LGHFPPAHGSPPSEPVSDYGRIACPAFVFGRFYRRGAADAPHYIPVYLFQKIQKKFSEKFIPS